MEQINDNSPTLEYIIKEITNSNIANCIQLDDIEIDVLFMLEQGASILQIAEQYSNSVSQIKYVIMEMYEKYANYLSNTGDNND